MLSTQRMMVFCVMPTYATLFLVQTMPYRLNEETGLIDYDMLEKTAKLFRPKLIVAGKSNTHTRHIAPQTEYTTSSVLAVP
mgnify:CR=1 FL=1